MSIMQHVRLCMFWCADTEARADEEEDAEEEEEEETGEEEGAIQVASMTVYVSVLLPLPHVSLFVVFVPLHPE